MDKFVVVDYQEGAGGEFMARFISAHFGHKLEFDQQEDPDHLQKWLNSNSLVAVDWAIRFQSYLEMFIEHCQDKNVSAIAVPYHLYKWPSHVHIIKQVIPNVRFVRINCEDSLSDITADFERKVLNRVITDFQELKFLLINRDRQVAKFMLELYQQKQLTYRDIFPAPPHSIRYLPSKDVEIQYRDFFSNFDRTKQAYEKLCSELNIAPDLIALSSLLERNQKNKQDLDKHLSNS